MTNESDRIHYYWTPEGTRGFGFYASGPIPSEGEIVLFPTVKAEHELNFYYRSVGPFAGYGHWQELVPIRCATCMSFCQTDPPREVYEFWFCGKQCNLVFAYRLLMER